MGGRARGANLVMALAFESSYGVPPTSGFFQMPLAEEDFGEEQGLTASELIGLGREPAPPSLDVINNEGSGLKVPVDARYFGLWLKAQFGAPTTTQGLPASGTFSFTQNPANNSKITVNGTDVTFVSGTPTAGQVKIETAPVDTLTNLVLMLNSSTDNNIKVATYSLDATALKVNIEHDTIGVSGNSFTITSGNGSNATASGATLTGGAATGAYNHVFASGALELPSASIEVGHPNVPSYSMNYGYAQDKIAITVQRSGNLQATLSYIAQGERDPTLTSAAGSLTSYALTRFTHFRGFVSRSGVPLGDLTSGNLTIANGGEKVEDCGRGDGRISGVDPGQAAYTGQAVVRFRNEFLRTQARNGLPIDITYGWRISLATRLWFTFHEIYLPVPKRSVTGPGGISETYNWQGAKNTTIGRACTATLVNDVASYA